MRALEVATKHYFWKPFMAYFAAFELNAYHRARWTPEGVALDLGCSDGTFAQMLKELVGFGTRPTAADISPVTLRRAAKRRELYQHVVRLDACSLPFKDETFDSIMANAMFCALRPDPFGAAREVYRVLKCGGSFACTVPTNTANQHYAISKQLESVGLSWLGKWYRHRVDSRLGNVWQLAPDAWEGAFAGAGLIVEKTVPYISAVTTHRWSLYLKIPRVLSLLKLVKSTYVQSAFAAAFRRNMVKSYQRHHAVPPGEQGDYILIVCKKPT